MNVTIVMKTIIRNANKANLFTEHLKHLEKTKCYFYRHFTFQLMQDFINVKLYSFSVF